MKPRIKIFVLTCFALFGCSISQEIQNPRVDFHAKFFQPEQTNEPTQILFRISLLNTNADLLKYGLSEPTMHQERIAYYINGFKEHIHLISKGDTIPCVDSHFERLQMDVPYRNFILTFPSQDVDEDTVLLIEDIVFSNNLVQVSIENENE